MTSAAVGPGPSSVLPGGAIGLVFRRPYRIFGIEPWLTELVLGIEDTVSPHGLAVAVHVAPDTAGELRLWRRWIEDRSVAAILVTDVLEGDRRLRELADADLPVLQLGREPGEDTVLPAVLTHQATTALAGLTALTDLGHRRIGVITGPSALRHTQLRQAALQAECIRLGVELRTAEGTYEPESGRVATERLLDEFAPTALFYDSDTMAVAGLDVARERGLVVPDELSVLAWNDTGASRLSDPPLSVISTDVHAIGATVGRALLALLESGSIEDCHTPPGTVLLRGSTAPVAVRLGG